MKTSPLKIAPKKKINTKRILLIITAAAVLILVALGFFFALRAYKQFINSPEYLLGRIGALYDLPKNEKPTIALVSDKSKLEKQPFFIKAENGDRVIIYTTAKKALIYRPSINKIMEIAPLAISEPTPPAKKTAEKATISIFNGTKIAGLATRTEKNVLAEVAGVTVVEKGNAGKDYTSTLVIDTTGNKSVMAKSIAALLGGSVGALPAGEKSPKGDILVIVGR